MQAVINKSTRKKFIEIEPRLKNRPIMALFSHILLSHYDSSRTYTHLSHKFLRKINGNKCNNWKSEQFLLEFQDIFPDFVYSGYSKAKGLTREVLCSGIPNIFYQVYEESLSVDDKKVFWESGKAVNPKNAKQIYSDNLDYVNQTFLADNPQGKTVMDYHNGLIANTFTKKINETYDEALALTESYKDNADVYRQTKATLDNIRAFPKPILKTVKNSDRLFAYSPNLNTIKSDVRKVLTKGWWEVDMRNAQLAIIAKIWDIPELNDFLAKGESIWTELLSFLDLPVAYKPVIKTAIYTLCFGGGMKGITEKASQEVTKEGLDPFNINPMFEHPLIKAVIARKDEMMKQVMTTPPINPLTNRKIYADNTPMSRLAVWAQAYELLLIHSIYGVQDDAGFQIMVYQFDGVTIDFRDERTRGYWTQQINQTFNQKAKDLGIITSLEWSHNTPVTEKLTPITWDELVEPEIQEIIPILETVKQPSFDLFEDYRGIDFESMTDEQLQAHSDSDPYSPADGVLRRRKDARRWKERLSRYTEPPF